MSIHPPQLRSTIQDEPSRVQTDCLLPPTTSMTIWIPIESSTPRASAQILQFQHTTSPTKSPLSTLTPSRALVPTLPQRPQPRARLPPSTNAAFPQKVDHDLPADDNDRMSIASTVSSLAASIFGQVDAVRKNNFWRQRLQFNAELCSFAGQYVKSKTIPNQNSPSKRTN